MTVEEFDRTRGSLVCQHCGKVGLCRKQVPISSWEPVCPACKQPHPIAGVQYLKQNNVRRRHDYPVGESVAEVWARFGDRCVVCSSPKSFLLRERIGLERQHVAPYATHGHQGPIVPMCSNCHQIATQLQKMRGFVRHVLEAPDGVAVSASRSGLSGDGVSPDPLSPETENPFSQLETVPDDDADD